MFPYNIASALTFMGMSIYLMYESSSFPKDEYANFQPGSWPFFLAAVMLVLSFSFLVETLVRKKLSAVRPNTETAEQPAPFQFRSRGMLYVGALCGIFAVFSAILYYFGSLRLTRVSSFTVASLFLIPSCMYLLGEKRPRMLAAVTIGVPLVVHIIFARVLGIRLP